eukprot:jgi/Undpi1/10846/HiC_scaffold_3.g01373.m1
MQSSTTLRGVFPFAEHPPCRTGSVRPWDGRRPSAVFMMASPRGGATTSPPPPLLADEGCIAEVVRGHSIDEGRPCARGSQRVGWYQSTPVAVSRTMTSASGFSNSNELKQHNQHEQEDNNSLHSYYYGYRDGSYNLAPTTPEYSNTPASESAFFFGGEERNGFSSVPPPRKLVYPGATNVVGAIHLSTEEIDFRLSCAHAKQEAAYPLLQRGFEKMSVATLAVQVSEVDQVVDRLAMEGGAYTPYRTSVDAVVSAIVNIGRTIPAVLVYMALKLDENFPMGSLLPNILAAFNVWEPEHYREVARQMERIEWSICRRFNFAVLPETPITFLHLFIARAVSKEALLDDQTVRIGELAAKSCLRWVRAGFLAFAKPSEMAGAAFELAVFREGGAEAADRISRAAGCPMAKWNDAMPLCRVFRKSSGLLNRAPGARPACARKMYGGCGGSGGGACSGGWLRPIPTKHVRCWDVADLERGFSTPGGDICALAQPTSTAAAAAIGGTPTYASAAAASCDTADGVGSGSGGSGGDCGVIRRYAEDVTGCARALAKTEPGQAIGCQIIAPIPRRPLPVYWQSVISSEGSYPYPGGDAAGTTQPPRLPNPDAVISAFAVAQGYAEEVTGCARAPAETGPGQAVGCQIIAPIPRRPLPVYWQNEINSEACFPYPGREAAGTTQPPPLPTADAVISAFAIPGPVDTAAGVGGGDGVGDGDVVGASGYDSGIAACVRVPADMGPRQAVTSTEIIAPVPRRPLPQHLRNVIDLNGSNPNPGGNIADIVQPPPLPSYSAVAAAFAFNSYLARRRGVAHTRVEAQACQRVRVQRLWLEVQRGRVMLERQDGRLQRQKVLMQHRGRELQRQRQLEEAQATESLVFWDSGGLLKPVVQTFSSTAADTWRVARAAVVSPGLSRG